MVFVGLFVLWEWFPVFAICVGIGAGRSSRSSYGFDDEFATLHANHDFITLIKSELGQHRLRQRHTQAVVAEFDQATFVFLAHRYPFCAYVALCYIPYLISEIRQKV